MITNHFGKKKKNFVHGNRLIINDYAITLEPIVVQNKKTASNFRTKKIEYREKKFEKLKQTHQNFGI